MYMYVRGLKWGVRMGGSEDGRECGMCLSRKVGNEEMSTCILTRNRP